MRNSVGCASPGRFSTLRARVPRRALAAIAETTVLFVTAAVGELLEPTAAILRHGTAGEGQPGCGGRKNPGVRELADLRAARERRHDGNGSVFSGSHARKKGGGTCRPLFPSGVIQSSCSRLSPPFVMTAMAAHSVA